MELIDPFKAMLPETRSTTLTYQQGDASHWTEDEETMIYEWFQERPWCGQTVFTFAVTAVQNQ